VPALFWSSAQYFVRAAFALARAHSVPPEYIYANTAGLRRDMTFLGAFVGWLPLDYGIWRGKYDTEIDPRRTSYLAVTFPAVDDMWAFYFPSWSSRSLTKHVSENSGRRGVK
jgi:hypothetical protein